MNKGNREREKGFTLVELLVVIAIIGVLAAVIAPNAFRAVEKSKVSRTLSDLKAFKTAALAFYADVGFFPADPMGGSPNWYSDPGLGSDPTTNYSTASITALGFSSLSQYNTAVTNNWRGPYVEAPITKKTAWGGRYDYECWGPGVSRSPSTIPNGIYITIHEVPRKSADLLVELSTFEVVGGQHYDDDVSSDPDLRKVTLKICDWPN